MLCPKCGKQIADGSPVCPFCSQPLVSQVQPQVQPVVQQPVQQVVQPVSPQVVQPVLPGQVVEERKEVDQNAPVMYSAPIPQETSNVNYAQANYSEIKSETTNAQVMAPVEEIVKQPQDRIIVTNGITDMRPQEMVVVEQKPVETPVVKAEDIIGKKKSNIDFKKIFLVLFLIVILVVGSIAVLYFGGFVKVKTNVTKGSFTQTSIASKKTITANIDGDEKGEGVTTSTTEEVKYTTTTAALSGVAFPYKGLIFTIPTEYRIAEENGVKSIDRIDGSLNIRIEDVYTGSYDKAVSEIENLKQHIADKYVGALNINSVASSAGGLKYVSVSFRYAQKNYHIIYFELNSTYLVETICYSNEFNLDVVANKTASIVASAKANAENVASSEFNGNNIVLPII